MITNLYQQNASQNREVSWLRFDDRVLNEAKDASVPLLERLKFVAIYTSNLEEFFRVRVGSLKDLERGKYNTIDNKSGLTPKGQLDLIYPIAKRGCKKRDKIYTSLKKEMQEAGICDLDIAMLNKEQMRYVKKYYRQRIEPLLTAQIVDAHHPFPNFISGVTYIAAVLKKKKKTTMFAFVAVPPSLDDIVMLEDKDTISFVHTGEIIRHFIAKLYPDTKVVETLKFKLARSAYVDPEDEAFDDVEDYRKKMMKVLKERRKMNVTAIEFSEEPSKELKNYLISNLKIEPQMIFLRTSPFSFRYAYKLAKYLPTEKKTTLLYPPYEPKRTVKLNPKNIFEQIQRKDVLLSYPYESMNTFLTLLKEAADDPDVVSIKITIYRLAKHARLVEYLCQAAQAGKEVDVLIELKARFDEQNNIDYSEILEEAGCHVFYGFEHYKVHAKICLITKQTDKGLENVVTISTGNFNENTAKLYTDLVMMSARKALVNDALAFFQNMFIGKLDGKYKALWVAPVDLKKNILESIRQETAKGKDGYIFFKINGISDEDIMQALMDASNAGVKVEMIVRGISCLLPHVPSRTENITVLSIVGRFLEHSRIYVFSKGRSEKMFISSADLMTRNTEHRVEIATPIYNSDLKKEIHTYIQTYMADNVKARVLQPTGRYRKVQEGQRDTDAQQILMETTKGTAPLTTPIVKHQTSAYATRFKQRKGKL